MALLCLLFALPAEKHIMMTETGNVNIYFLLGRGELESAG
jgi:hypothetical protein